MKSKAVDLFVLGAGSGGLAAAKRAASYGANVVIAESDRVGGTCVIRGCIPKKLMAYASYLGASRAMAADFGWLPAPAEFSWRRLVEVRDQVVNNLELAHQRHLATAKVTCIPARATLVDAQTVEAAGQTYHAGQILIATGATPTLPQVDGRQHCIVSDDFFKLAEMPERAVLVGGGYISVEFACLLAGLGCRTHVLVRSKLLRSFDADISDAMVAAMRQHGIEVTEHVDNLRVSTSQGGTVVQMTAAGSTHSIGTNACILFATGRQPNSTNLGLERLGVQLDPQGAVQVDAHHTTAVRTIHALGDVINRANLTPVAIKAGRTWADRVFGKKEVEMSYETIATAVFGQPPIGAVGLTEAEAVERHGPKLVRIFKTRFIPMLFSATPQERKRASVIKIVVHADSDKVLGFHMLGDEAPEIIQGFAAAMAAGITKAQLDKTLAVHPTQAEEFVLMR